MTAAAAPGTRRARPFVTIAVPCYNEAGFVEACVRTIFAQTYPADRMEILVADGLSDDGTREILARLSEADARLRVLDSKERLQAPGMNRMIREARGEIVVRMDVHCEYAPNYVEACVDVLERTGADNVGGAQRPRHKTRFQRALCAALESPLGVGGAAYRSASKEGFVDTVFLGAFRREVFDRVGLYDPNAVTNEDAELNQRLINAGGRIYLSREIEVYYYPRSGFRALSRQYFRYGYGRARTLLKHRRFLSWRSALPFSAVAGAAVLVIVPGLRRAAPLAFGAYAVLTACEAARVGLCHGLGTVPLTWAIFPVLHVSHGAGFAVGLVRYGAIPDWPQSGETNRSGSGETSGSTA
jgi:glycosyltransferase involved in cell wall biosynthesis